MGYYNSPTNAAGLAAAGRERAPPRLLRSQAVHTVRPLGAATTHPSHRTHCGAFTTDSNFDEAYKIPSKNERTVCIPLISHHQSMEIAKKAMESDRHARLGPLLTQGAPTRRAPLNF